MNQGGSRLRAAAAQPGLATARSSIAGSIADFGENLTTLTGRLGKQETAPDAPSAPPGEVAAALARAVAALPARLAAAGATPEARARIGAAVVQVGCDLVALHPPSRASTAEGFMPLNAVTFGPGAATIESLHAYIAAFELAKGDAYAWCVEHPEYSWPQRSAVAEAVEGSKDAARIMERLERETMRSIGTGSSHDTVVML